MEKQIYDESNGLWYERSGDYYLPLLTLPPQEDKPIGIWGQRHLRYIKQNKRCLYSDLLMSGKLNSHLADIDRQAKETMSELMKQLAEKEGVTERLKADNQMEWVRAMKNCYHSAEEIIFNELIYT